MRLYSFLLVVMWFWQVLCCPLYAQETRWDWAVLLGTVTVGQTQWQRLDLQPHILLGDFEAVLDVELFLDETGKIRDRGWDFSTRRKGLESLLRKIHYVRYGDVDDWKKKVYVRVGALESVTLGTGLLMRNYRNTQDGPGVKRTGLDIQLRQLYDERVTLRAMVSDLLDLDGGGPIVGGRVVFHPMTDWDMGFTLVVDTDQLHALPDSVRAGRPRDAYGTASVDVMYPLIRRGGLQTFLYGGVARVLSSQGGTGVSGPGLTLAMGGFQVQGEYRWVTGRFRPGHFDALYDGNRAVVDPVSGGVTTREAALPDVSMKGIFADAKWTLGSLVTMGGSYQFLTGQGIDAQILEGRVALSSSFLDKVPKITEAEAYYEKRLDSRILGGILDGTPDTRFGYRLGVTPLEHLVLIWEVEFTYEPDGLGGFQRRRILNVQSKMDF